MIKKAILCCCFLLLAFAAFSQETSGDTTNKTSDTTVLLKKSGGFTTNVLMPGGQNSINTPALTNVLPAAPNAFELTRYSSLPVNMATGSVSTKIPLGDLKSGKVDIPVQLAYNSGNGLQINQTASRA
ncbi:hypothetical protein [Mucilaginibacter sp. L3T2-6]|uniref:hypothetical protein n=1 Tax=Mucilaginibacter sp. L3T2-6 TaxID=3062491 RepID=UPI00267751F4|nr:hypothetical protein [Mucilaginibacter sp. L3T2-6]MDO3645084.1 hypothetical protein [Mucilaginibacter sp. L3T2-6]MDV6217535.1 hypothetical protein [Mucilaginibacter sp. L3T2-6]